MPLSEKAVNRLYSLIAIDPIMVWGKWLALAGFVLHELEHIPATGETFSWRGFDFEVIDMDGQRIDKLLVKIS